MALNWVSSSRKLYLFTFYK